MHRTIVAAVALLGLAVSMAGAAPAPDSAAGGATMSTGGAPATPAATTAKPAGAASAAKPAATPGAAMKTKAGQDVVVLETAVGDIVIKLAEADAPKTCANFRKLVASKFYDGTYFHRVIPGFMIQGGDPNSKNADPSDDGVGGPGYTVPAEIKLKHLRGSVATARQGDAVNPKKDSSGSQFFIDLAPQPSLDAGGYTVFGEVVSGMDAVDKIAALANEPGVAQAAGGGANPQKKALIKRAFLAPASKYAAPAAATGGAAPAKAPAKADTTKK
ncbi:MAG TPA: peptidylprolyl isomerase [Candidatus Eisenbacteria bacterium]